MFNRDIFFEASTRSLCVFGATEPSTYKDTLECLMRLSHHLPRKPLRLFFSGGGFSVEQAISIIDVLALVKGRIETNAFSDMEGPMLLLFLIGKRRLMLPHCSLKFGDMLGASPIGFAPCRRNESASQTTVRLLLEEALGAQLYSLLTDYPKLSCEQAINLGLAESLVGPRRSRRSLRAEKGVR